MTFNELMNTTSHLQTVNLIISADTIAASACAMARWVSEEIDRAKVKEIAVKGDMMRVWLEL